MSPGSSKSPSWRRKRHLSKMDRRRLHFYSRMILTTSAPRILFIWSIVFHSKFWHGQQANFSACTGCSIMSHIATAPQTMQQTSVQKSQDLQNPTATSIKSHCQSLLLRGMAPRSIFSGSPVVYQEAPLQFPFANSPKDFWRKVIQAPQIHNKNEKKKCVLVCVTADDLSMPASPNTVMVSSLGTHLYIWQFFSFQLQVHHELFYKTSTAQSKHWKKMRPLQKVGRANQSSNLASPVTCKCNNDFSGPIKAQEWGFRLAVPPSHMAKLWSNVSPDKKQQKNYCEAKASNHVAAKRPARTAVRAFGSAGPKTHWWYGSKILLKLFWETIVNCIFSLFQKQ